MFILRKLSQLKASVRLIIGVAVFVCVLELIQPNYLVFIGFFSPEVRSLLSAKPSTLIAPDFLRATHFAESFNPLVGVLFITLKLFIGFWAPLLSIILLHYVSAHIGFVPHNRNTIIIKKKAAKIYPSRGETGFYINIINKVVMNN